MKRLEPISKILFHRVRLSTARGKRPCLAFVRTFLRSVLAVFAVGLTLSSLGIAAPTMKPGLWEITTSMEGAGMPASMPPTKIKHCYRAEDLKDLRNTVPEKNSNCKVSNWKESGNTVTWNMACTGEHAMTGSGRITYSGDSYAGTNKMTMSHGGQKMTMSQKYNAKRVGDCR